MRLRLCSVRAVARCKMKDGRVGVLQRRVMEGLNGEGGRRKVWTGLSLWSKEARVEGRVFRDIILKST